MFSVCYQCRWPLVCFLLNQSFQYKESYFFNIHLLNSYRCADHYYSIDDDVAADCVICSYLCGNCLFRDKYCLTCNGGDNRTPWTDLNYNCLY